MEKTRFIKIWLDGDVVDQFDFDFDEKMSNEDNNRYVELGSMVGARYELYEDHEFIGGTSDVVAAAQFIAEGWNYNE